jgi:hypothetical protein
MTVELGVSAAVAQLLLLLLLLQAASCLRVLQQFVKLHVKLSHKAILLMLPDQL